jgi:outer membrane protein assembly factor BamE (lipoprotein component of BamABCDE complex)
MKIRLLLLSLLVIAGCASVGNRALRTETSQTLDAKIVEGKTTKQEVRTMFGSPQNTSFTDSGLEIYHYEFSELESKAVNFVPVVNLFARGFDGTKKTLTVLFDRDDVVTRYSMETSPVDIRAGIFK